MSKFLLCFTKLFEISLYETLLYVFFFWKNFYDWQLFFLLRHNLCKKNFANRMSRCWISCCRWYTTMVTEVLVSLCFGDAQKTPRTSHWIFCGWWSQNCEKIIKTGNNFDFFILISFIPIFSKKNISCLYTVGYMIINLSLTIKHTLFSFYVFTCTSICKLENYSKYI